MLLLDEPTTNLELDAIEWLEGAPAAKSITPRKLLLALLRRRCCCRTISQIVLQGGGPARIALSTRRRTMLAENVLFTTVLNPASSPCRVAGYLKKQEVPMVIVSHDREFLDQLCTKIVETEHGVATTYKVLFTWPEAAPAVTSAGLTCCAGSAWGSGA